MRYKSIVQTAEYWLEGNYELSILKSIKATIHSSFSYVNIINKIDLKDLQHEGSKKLFMHANEWT